jgi:hypothetical protein
MTARERRLHSLTAVQYVAERKKGTFTCEESVVQPSHLTFNVVVENVLSDVVIWLVTLQCSPSVGSPNIVLSLGPDRMAH